MRACLLLFVAGPTLAMACGSTQPSTFGKEGSSSSSSSGFGGGSSTGGLDPTTTPKDGCAAAAQLVYVVSAEDDLYSFTPNKGTFSKIGRLTCTAAGTPNSMAIDRQGNAWVNYTDGNLFKVSTTNASCQPTTFQPNQEGITKFGMAFATNGANSTDETLYISGLKDDARLGVGLFTIDLKTMKVGRLGDFSANLAGLGAELTGTGEGKLFGFFATAPNATLAEIDKIRGSTSADKALDGVKTGDSWAFSFWGGDFWFYTADKGVPSSKVTRFSTTAGSVSITSPDVGGFRIVGAGVSTCAPTTDVPK